MIQKQFIGPISRLKPCRIRVGAGDGAAAASDGEVVEGRVRGEACELITDARGARLQDACATEENNKKNKAKNAESGAAGSSSSSSGGSGSGDDDEGAANGKTCCVRRNITRVELCAAGAKTVSATVTVGPQEYVEEVADEVFTIRGYRMF